MAKGNVQVKMANGGGHWNVRYYHEKTDDNSKETPEFLCMSSPEDPVPHPITDELDLHTFQPREIGSLLPEYFAECVSRGIWRVRIIHGKGTGALRESVHQILQRLPQVVEFKLADAGSGGWGATWVTLRKV